MAAGHNGKSNSARKPAAKKVPSAKRPASKKSGTYSNLPENIALVLQGGGALGAYQVGVYQGLHEAVCVCHAGSIRALHYWSQHGRRPIQNAREWPQLPIDLGCCLQLEVPPQPPAQEENKTHSSLSAP